jgi:hypothetical protein
MEGKGEIVSRIFPRICDHNFIGNYTIARDGSFSKRLMVGWRAMEIGRISFPMQRHPKACSHPKESL